MLFHLNMAFKNLILITIGLIFLNGVHTAPYDWYARSMIPRDVSPLSFEDLHENEQPHDPHAQDSKHPDPHAQDSHHQPDPHAQDHPDPHAQDHPDPHAQDHPDPHAQDTNHPDPHAQDTKHPTQEQNQDKGNTQAPPQMHLHTSHHHPHHHHPSHHHHHHHHHRYDENQKHTNCHAACNIICGGAGSWNAARDACQCAIHEDKVPECAKKITKIQQETGWPRELIVAGGGAQEHADYGYEHHRAYRSIERPITLLFPYH